MIRILNGPNFSGRSAWLEARAIELPWPRSAMLQYSGESALTGLATSVGEELGLSTAPWPGDTGPPQDGIPGLVAFELEPLMDRALHLLSGGEMVRCALASAIAQGVQELLIDVALEQLDTRWRSLLLAAFGKANAPVSLTIADNRLSKDELAMANETVRFGPADGISVPALNAANLANGVDEASGSVQLTSVSFRYARRLPHIFEDLSLTLEPGRLYVLAGPNGAGKTSLLRLLSGTVVPRRGEITFRGLRFDPSKRERYMALSFQNPDFQFSHATTGDEIAHGLGVRESDAGVEASLQAGGLSASLTDMSPFDCPFTFKKRLANLLAVLAGKPVVAFDEPTLGQDEAYRAEFAKLAGLLTSRGRTILLISHDEALLKALPDKVVLSVGGGRVVPAQ